MYIEIKNYNTMADAILCTPPPPLDDSISLTHPGEAVCWSGRCRER